MAGMHVFKKVAVVSGIVVVAALVSAYDFNKQAGSGKVSTVSVMTVSSDSASDTIVAEGNVLPSHSAVVNVMPDMVGRVTAVNVDIGSRVTKGEILAVIDPDTAAYDYNTAVNTANSAKAKLELLKHPYYPEQIEEKKLLVQADESAIHEAEQRLKVLIEGARPQEIQVAQSDVDSAQTKLKLSQSQYDRLNSLYKQDLAPKADVDTAEADVDVDKSALAQAKARLSLLQAGNRPEDIAIARSVLDRARITYAEDLAGYKVMLKGTQPQEIAEAESQLQIASIASQQKADVLQRRFVRAPISGVITGRYVNPGEIAMSSAVRVSPTALFRNNPRGLFTIADDTKMDFLANIDQHYFKSVKVGQAAVVTIESLQGRTYRGIVTRKTPVINPDLGIKGSSIAINPSTPFTFNAWIRIANPDRQLLPGMLGQITISRSQSGVAVPISAITPFALNKGMVYVEANGSIETRQIRYTETINGEARIMTGLIPGEHVVVSSFKDLASGVKVKPVEVGKDYLTTQKI